MKANLKNMFRANQYFDVFSHYPEIFTRLRQETESKIRIM